MRLDKSACGQRLGKIYEYTTNTNTNEMASSLLWQQLQGDKCCAIDKPQKAQPLHVPPPIGDLFVALTDVCVCACV